MKTIRIIFIFSAIALTSQAQWQPDVRLTNAPNNSATSYNNARSIAAGGNTVHVLWTDNRGGSGGYYQIFYKRSLDSGSTWSQDTQMTTNSWYLTGHPSIAVSGSNVHLTWIYNHNAYGMLFYKHSTDGGTSWTLNQQLTNTSYSVYYPSIAVSGQFLNLCFSHWQNSNIYYVNSTTGGTAWTSPVLLSTNNNLTSLVPSVSSAGQNVCAVWQDISNNAEINYSLSTDNGATWGGEARLTFDPAVSVNPCVFASGSTIHVVWQDNRDGNYEIYYKRTSNFGISWDTDIRLTNSTDSSCYPSVYVSGSNVHIVWQDHRDGNWEIYYKRSTDAGSSWESDTRLTVNSSVSQNPSTSAAGSAVYVVWSDSRDGNFEVYFKRNPTGNPLGINIISSEIPGNFSLSQNYPNPFNPSTKIRFDIPLLSGVDANDEDGLPAAGRGVLLRVYDILGNEVATLVDEELKPGTYGVEWDASNYSSGVYYYQLRAGDFNKSKKMILVR